MRRKKGKKENNNLRNVVIMAATVVVMAPIIIVIIQNVRHSVSIGFKIHDLNQEAKIYQQQIEKDSLLLEDIKYDEGLERYARENYFMQRRGERVFILE